MKIRYAALSLMLVAAVGYSPSGFADGEGTYSDCWDAFLDVRDEWAQMDDVCTECKTCFEIKGAAEVHLMGAQEVAEGGCIRYDMSARLAKAGKEKRCEFSIEMNGDVVYEESYVISGKDASRWNRFLKGDGCHSVSVLD